MKCRVKGCDRESRYKMVGYDNLCFKHQAWQRTHPGQPIVYKEQKVHEYHGMTKSSEYRVWVGIRVRCTDPNSIAYPYYGGRGIKICEKWDKSFLSFYNDMGKRPKGFTIERTDNNGDYTPENCKWATHKEQMRNKRINSNNKSGIVGVAWNKRDKNWSAELYRDGEKIFRGTFKKLEDAIQARQVAEQKYLMKIEAS